MTPKKSLSTKSLYNEFVGLRVRIATRFGVVTGELVLVSDYEVVVRAPGGHTILLKGTVLSVEVVPGEASSGQMVEGEVLSRLIGEQVDILVGGTVTRSGVLASVCRYELLLRVNGDKVVMIPKGGVDRIQLRGGGDRIFPR